MRRRRPRATYGPSSPFNRARRLEDVPVRLLDVFVLIKKVSEMPLALEPQEVLVTYEHAAARTRWWAEGADTRVEGNEVAVSRFAGDKIAEVWLWYDGYQAHDLVFSFDQRRPSSSAVPDF